MKFAALVTVLVAISTTAFVAIAHAALAQVA